MSAKKERIEIIRRTISQEIRLSLDGYWIREAVFGYQNKKIVTNEGKKRNIQVPDNVESGWIVRAFILRSEGYSDSYIVDEVNRMGYLSRYQKIWDKSKTTII